MSQSLRVVVADDEPDMRDYFQKMLPRLGHQVVAVAENGRELVELCAKYRPDLVVSDIRMPELNGLDAAIEVFENRPIPIILLSAYHDPAMLARTEADHVMVHLVKPIKLSDLEAAIPLAVKRLERFEDCKRVVNEMHQSRDRGANSGSLHAN